VEGSGSSDVLQCTIDSLDDPFIDFIVHWDAKDSQPRLRAKRSHIYFIPARKVSWGTDSQILATRDLLKYALNSRNDYEYFHLISESDVPLMSSNYFKSFFESVSGSDFVGYGSQDILNDVRRIRWYFPVHHVNLKTRGGRLLVRFLKTLNWLFQVHRPGPEHVYKGTNWFSITRKSAMTVLEADIHPFLNSYLGDETWIQSILAANNEQNIHISKNDTAQALRYIDWSRGNPYVFNFNDLPELKTVWNTKYAFVRKIKNSEVSRKLIENGMCNHKIV
jgi:hypothetical protein